MPRQLLLIRHCKSRANADVFEVWMEGDAVTAADLSVADGEAAR